MSMPRPLQTQMSDRHRETYVALIRGINVGRAKRVAMADLRTLVERLGFIDVRTVLNSGNIVFAGDRAAAKDAAGRIEKSLAAELGVSARIIVLRRDELGEIVSGNPLPSATSEPSRFLVAVVRAPKDLERLQPLEKQDWSPEVLAVGKRAAYLWCPDGILGGKLVEAAGRALGDAVTMRNWATINRILDLQQK